MRAWDICGEIHGDIRADGSTYCDHPRAAAWILIKEIGIRDPRLLILELLHDTGEVKKGRPFTCEDVAAEFKDDFLTMGHKAITKLPDQHPRDYTAQVFAGGVKVAIVKFADRLHNHRTLSACDREKQDRIITDTWMYYYPYSGYYKAFLQGTSRRERKSIDSLWELIQAAITELLATR